MSHEPEPYRERAARLPGAVLWTRTADGGAYRILPDGCMDLLWIEGELLVAGPDTKAYVSSSARGARCAAIRFAPGTAPGFLGVPAREVVDHRVPLADLWSRGRARRLADRIARAGHPAPGLEEAAVMLFDEPPDRLVGQVVQGIRRGIAVPALAGSVGLSERQLHRRCLDAFGYGPKMLDRVLRMNRALDHARTGLTLATVAAQTGYADQAHLTREVKALTGVPPRVLLQA
ncbi:AraC family transcriptional regulator [Kribbella voronezhensis]|uniref:AraC family transcriptional regulator n=1 Tax=Kribbella voronezhensis TaxID=2512212 RepID=A0A4R7TAU8_9ACTN|nr:helix-turn-helix transcriptional regulator [Kribbella voronezhensis]TDU88418.1 AraC family transcriptional regulator [Kribbella voronezhensis]